MEGTKIVKRYANRKLYDTETSSYVTLKNVAEAIASGRDVQVVDNVSKEDITSTTLLAALVDVETSGDLNGQTSTLRDILKAGGLGKYLNALKGGN